MESHLRKLQKTTPEAYKEFESFLRMNYSSMLEFHRLTIDTMPSEFLLGFIFKFFLENQLEFTVSDIDDNVIYEAITDTFVAFEKTISHYS